MLSRFWRLGIATALAVALGPRTLHAGAITYPDFSTWSAAVSGVTTVTVPDPTPDAFIFFGSGTASVAYSGVTFSTSSGLSDGNFYNVGPGFSGVPAVLSSQQQSFGVANILITFPATIWGFGVNYGTFSGSAVTFALSNGDSFTLGSTGSGYAVPDFFGVTDSPFTSVLVTSPDGVLNINDISSAVPEPASLVLLASGLAALGAHRRRRHTT